MHPFRFSPFVVTILVLGIGCGGSEGIDVEHHTGLKQAAIVNGISTTDYPAVGMIQIGNGGLCTGTLVGQRTVITAAHCLQPGASYWFMVGGGSYQANSAHAHPNWSTYTLTNDIALLLLSQAPDVPSMPVATSAPSVGQEITLVGFGVTGETQEDAGIKRVATNTINDLDSARFSFAGSGAGTGSTCFGDSGGPAFATLGGKVVQIGVTSSGQAPCGTLAYDTRVDAYEGWLNDTADGDLNRGASTPTPSDVNPEVMILSPSAGATVSSVVTVTATITDDEGILRGELAVDGQLVSTLQAAPFNFSATLNPGTHTMRVTGFDGEGNHGMAEVVVMVGATDPTDPNPDPEDPGVISPNPGAEGPVAREYGSPCSGPEDCNSGMCAEDPGFIGKYCTAACVPDSSPCPMGAGCYPTTTNQSFVCGAPQATLPIVPISMGQSSEADRLIGGCSVGGGKAKPSVWMLILGLLFFRRRRRR